MMNDSIIRIKSEQQLNIIIIGFDGEMCSIYNYTSIRVYRLHIAHSFPNILKYIEIG